MILTRKMWDRACARWDEKWDNISGRVTVLNHEYGKIQTTVKLNMWLTGAILLGVLGIAWAVIQKFFLGA